MHHTTKGTKTPYGPMQHCIHKHMLHKGLHNKYGSNNVMAMAKEMYHLESNIIKVVI